MEFLRAKGGVGLLVSLNEGEKMWMDLRSELGVATDTLNARRNEAAEIGLIEKRDGQRHGRDVDLYRLTDMGEAVAGEMVRSGLATNWQSMRTHEENVDILKEELLEWVRKRSGDLMTLREANEETFIIQDPSDEESSPDSEEPNSDTGLDDENATVNDNEGNQIEHEGQSNAEEAEPNIKADDVTERVGENEGSPGEEGTSDDEGPNQQNLWDVAEDLEDED